MQLLTDIISGINIAVGEIGSLASYELVTAAQRDEVDGIRADKRRRERLATYAIVNQCISHGLMLGHHDDGAPFLIGEDGATVPIDFSLSHSRRYVAIAWRQTATLPFGVDIEESTPRLERVVRKYLAPTEQTFVGHDADALLAAWTLKEAVYKAARIPGLALTATDGQSVGGIAIEAWHPHDDATVSARAAIPGRRFTVATVPAFEALLSLAY